MIKNNWFFLLKNRIIFSLLLFSFITIVFTITPPLYSMNGEEEAPKNILLITIDTLRADRLSCYGNASFKTPNIDGLAERGILYSRAFAHNSLTLPSHTNILLGTTPLYHGVQDNFNFIVKDNFLTLAEYLKKFGYSTGAFIGGSPLDSKFGLDQGFDVYDDDFAPVGSSGLTSAERKAEEVLEKTLKWMKNQSSPWFVWIHLFDPHYSYEPPEPFLSRFKTTPYDGEVAYTDYTLGWAPLLGYISQKDKFFDSPIPELYDLVTDFDEKNNLAGSTNLEDYKKTLEQLILQQSIPEDINARNRIDNSTLMKLRSLGYVGNPMSAQKETFSRNDDIKTLLPIYNRTVKAFKLKDTGQIQDGISQLNTIMQEEQSVDFAYSYLAQLYKESRQIENALKVLREGLNRHPTSSEILNVFSEYLLDSGKFDELIDLLGAGNLSQMERDPKFFNRLGIAYMNKNDLENGMNAFEMALAIDSEYVDALFNLGTIYLTLSMKNNDKSIIQKSMTYLRKVIELDPNNWKAPNSLGTVYLQSGEIKKALDSWEKTIELNPKSERTHYYLGLVYFSEGNLKESLIHLTTYKSDYYQFLSVEEKMKLDALLQLVRSKF